MDNRRVKYIVDEENKVIVAEIENCESDAMDMLMGKFVSSVTSGFDLYNKMFHSKFNMNHKYRAVAKLHPDDVWNEKRGRDIACDKLTETYHHSMNKRLALYAQDFRKIADEIDKYLAKKKFSEKA